jgi:hypothetical protein
MSTRTAIHLGLGTTLASWGSVALLRACSPLDDAPAPDDPLPVSHPAVPSHRVTDLPSVHPALADPVRSPAASGPAPRPSPSSDRPAKPGAP